jgi:hypothetical protein
MFQTPAPEMEGSPRRNEGDTVTIKWSSEFDGLTSMRLESISVSRSDPFKPSIAQLEEAHKKENFRRLKFDSGRCRPPAVRLAAGSNIWLLRQDFGCIRPGVR